MTDSENIAYNNGIIIGMASKGIIKCDIQGRTRDFTEKIIPTSSWVHAYNALPVLYTLEE